MNCLLLDGDYVDGILVLLEPELCVQVPICRKMKLCCQFQIFFSVDVDVSVQHLLWNDLILLAAIDRYRRADGAVASFRLRPPSVVNRFGILEEAWIAQHLHQFTSFEHLVSAWAYWLYSSGSRNASLRFPWIMGAFCSCLQPDYSDHHGNQASSAFRNCMCLRCFAQRLINAVCSSFIFLIHVDFFFYDMI